MRFIAIPITLLLLAICPAPIAPDIHQPKQLQASPKQLSSRSTEPGYREVVMEATAYTHTGNRTYTGTWPTRGTIAVDPEAMPLGTRLWVDGYGYGTAEDTGGLIKGDIIDVFFEDEAECWKWGRRRVRVRIYE